MMAIFGNGTSLAAKTLADLQVGDQFVACDHRGEYRSMMTVKKKTAKTLWSGEKSIMPRYGFDGRQLNGRGRCRVVTRQDRRKFQLKKNQEAERKADEERRMRLTQEPEFRAAKNIGWELCDAADCQDEIQYLAFAKRIGLNNLLAFEKLVHEAKANTPRKRSSRRLRSAPEREEGGKRSRNERSDNPQSVGVD